MGDLLLLIFLKVESTEYKVKTARKPIKRKYAKNVKHDQKRAMVFFYVLQKMLSEA